MNYIYGSARQLVIILEDNLVPEPEEVVTNVWFEYLRNKPSGENITHGMPGWKTVLATVPEEVARLVQSLFSRVLSASWWTRAWCYHEIRVSSLDDWPLNIKQE